MYAIINTHELSATLETSAGTEVASFWMGDVASLESAVNQWCSDHAYQQPTFIYTSERQSS